MTISGFGIAPEPKWTLREQTSAGSVRGHADDADDRRPRPGISTTSMTITPAVVVTQRDGQQQWVRVAHNDPVSATVSTASSRNTLGQARRICRAGRRGESCGFHGSDEWALSAVLVPSRKTTQRSARNQEFASAVVRASTHTPEHGSQAQRCRQVTTTLTTHFPGSEVPVARAS